MPRIRRRAVRRPRDWHNHPLSRWLAYGGLGGGAISALAFRLREQPDQDQARAAWREIGAELLDWWQESGQAGEPHGLARFGSPN